MDDRTVPIDWPALALDQLVWHWEGFVRPHLDGLTDDELHWEPVPGCWGVRPRAEATSSAAAGAGEWVIDFAVPEPSPPPFTTIAWRLWHVIEGVFGGRASAHFGDGHGIDYSGRTYLPDAEGTLAALDVAFDRWVTGVRSLGADGLGRACGPAEGPFADHPMAELVLHINREAIHHGAEVLALRDLHRASGGRALRVADDVEPRPIAFQVTFDAADPHAQARFWAEALHYEVEDDDAVIRQLLDQGVADHTDVIEVDGRKAWAAAKAIVPPGLERGATGRILFMRVPEPRASTKNRLHLDLRVAGPGRTPEHAERLASEVARLEGLGAEVLYRKDLPEGVWVTLVDPEGNELCLT